MCVFLAPDINGVFWFSLMIILLYIILNLTKSFRINCHNHKDNVYGCHFPLSVRHNSLFGLRCMQPMVVGHVMTKFTALFEL